MPFKVGRSGDFPPVANESTLGLAAPSLIPVHRNGPYTVTMSPKPSPARSA